MDKYDTPTKQILFSILTRWRMNEKDPGRLRQYGARGESGSVLE